MAVIHFHPARYCRTKPHGRRRIIDRHADPECAGNRIGLRIDLPHPALCGDSGVVGQRDDHIGVSPAGAQHLSRNIEDGVPAGFARDYEHRLPRLHDLTRFRRAAGDRAVQAGLKLRVADAVLSDFDLGLGVIHCRLCRAQCLLGLVEIGAGRPALLQQGFLAIEMIGILLQPRLGSRQRGARGAKRVQLVLRIELSHHLLRLDAVTRIHRALDDPTADTEGKGDLLFRLDLSSQDD